MIVVAESDLRSRRYTGPAVLALGLGVVGFHLLSLEPRAFCGSSFIDRTSPKDTAS